MPRNKKAEEKLRQFTLNGRLEFIKRRHRELVLQPRELVASQIDDEFDEGFEEMADLEEAALAETMMDRL